jgi:hypothetical protein
VDTEEKMAGIDIEEFDRNYNDARGYHLRAMQFAGEKQRTSLIFNVASIAVERYLLALCAHYGIMPLNHNYGCLMDAVETAAGFDPGMAKNIRALDEIFGICSLEAYHHGAPVSGDDARVLSICDALFKMIEPLSAVPAQGS